MDHILHKTILVVDDNRVDADLIRRSFSHLPFELDFHYANDGSEAIAYLENLVRENPPSKVPIPDLIFLDLKMPKVTGFDVLRVRQQNIKLAIIPTVIFTSSSIEDDIIQAYALQTNAYVVKPIQFSVFQDHLHKLLLFWLQWNTVPSDHSI